MLSTPPTTYRSPSPARMPCDAKMTAFRLAPQTLFTVTAPTLQGRPPPAAHWRAMFWPRPADTTFPRITSSISSGRDTPARATAARTAAAPRSAAGTDDSAPWNRPTGVRTALTMTGCGVSLTAGMAELHEQVLRANAPILNHHQTLRARPGGGGVIDDPFLGPDGPEIGQVGQRGVHDRAHLLARPEDQDQIDAPRDVGRKRGQRGGDRPPENGGRRRVDGHDLEPRPVEMVRDDVAVFVRVTGQAHDRHGAAGLQDPPNLRGVVSCRGS